MKYVFGPVPSRRLGQSLGIDTIPLKTCNWNCVYCQLGRTTPLTNQRRSYFPPEEIIDEVKSVLVDQNVGEIDWITFVGSGEPTLHADIGWLIREVKTLAHLPVAVITNGATLYLEEVRQALLAADAVLPSFDAGDPWLYKKINRPHPDVSYQRLLKGLETFREEYVGQLWVEVMLVRGLNDTEQALNDIARALQMVSPNEVHINLPTRPPAETWVQPTDEDGLFRAQAILGNSARVVHPAGGIFTIGSDENLADAIVRIIRRHPMREDELVRTLEDYGSHEVGETLDELEASGLAQVVERYGIRFWSGSSAKYPNKDQSQRTSPKLSDG